MLTTIKRVPRLIPLVMWREGAKEHGERIYPPEQVDTDIRDMSATLNRQVVNTTKERAQKSKD